MTTLLVCTGFLINSAIVVVVLDVVVCKSGKVFFGAVCNLVIPPLKSGPLEVNKPSIDHLLPWPQNRNGDFQSHPNIWSSEENVWQCVQIKHVKHSEFFSTIWISYHGHTAEKENFDPVQTSDQPSLQFLFYMGFWMTSETSLRAPTYARTLVQNRLTRSLTGVKCRATSVAKKHPLFGHLNQICFIVVLLS